MSLDKQFKNLEARPVRTLVVWVLVAVLICGIGSIAATSMGFFTDAVATAKKEFSGSAMLKKYEWFKDAAEQIRKKKADVTMYQSRIDRFGSIDNLDRTDRESLMVWEQELLGVRASLNGLVAEYNAQSSKFNWSAFDTNESVPTFFETN